MEASGRTTFLACLVSLWNLIFAFWWALAWGRCPVNQGLVQGDTHGVPGGHEVTVVINLHKALDLRSLGDFLHAHGGSHFAGIEVNSGHQWLQGRSEVSSSFPSPWLLCFWSTLFLFCFEVLAMNPVPSTCWAVPYHCAAPPVHWTTLSWFVSGRALYLASI